MITLNKPRTITEAVAPITPAYLELRAAQSAMWHYAHGNANTPEGRAAEARETAALIRYESVQDSKRAFLAAEDVAEHREWLINRNR